MFPLLPATSVSDAETERLASPRDEWPALIQLRGACTRENAPLARFLADCGSPEAALAADPTAWEESCGFVPSADRLGPEARDRAEKAAQLLDRLGARIVDVRQPAYPKALRALPQPPAVLFVLGRAELLDRPGIAVVGTRQYSTYGRDATVAFVVGLVRAGYTIISGLARGIDSIAHRAALDVGGDTIGVLGTGLDVPYPPEHEELARAMAKHGCLISEFPPLSMPAARDGELPVCFYCRFGV